MACMVIVAATAVHRVQSGGADAREIAPIRRNGLITENAEQQFSAIAMAGNSC